MGTRANIGYINTRTGKLHFVYLNNDGYPSHAGKMLAEHFNGYRKVAALLKLGTISQLHPSIEKPLGHSFDTPKKGYSIFYKRDRGDTDDMSADIIDASKHDDMCENEYAYLFINGLWMAWNDKTETWKPLSDYIDSEGEYQDSLQIV